MIDDGSIDQTAFIAEQNGALVLKQIKNSGKGAAVQVGFDYFMNHAEYDFLILLDADGQHNPKDIPLFVDAFMKNQYDLVIGNRMQQNKNMPFDRKWTNMVTSKIVSFLAKIKVRDSQCGFRLLSRKLVQNLKLTTHQYDMESEMIIQAGRMGYLVGEVPIQTIYQNEVSQIHPLRDTINFIKLCFKYLT